MLRVARFALCVVLVLLLSAAGCDDDPPRSKNRGPSTSSAAATPTVATTSPSATPTTSATRLSEHAARTGVTINHNGKTIDRAGLTAIGWTINPNLGTAYWTDPQGALGEMSVVWEIPDASVYNTFDVLFWGDVTGANLAMNPTMSTSVFTGGPTESTAYSVGGQKAEAPMVRLNVSVPAQPAGSTASVIMNLGWPQPVLIIYTYTYV